MGVKICFIFRCLGVAVNGYCAFAVHGYTRRDKAARHVESMVVTVGTQKGLLLPLRNGNKGADTRRARKAPFGEVMILFIPKWENARSRGAGWQRTKDDAAHIGGGFNQLGFVPTAVCFSYSGGEITKRLRNMQIF